MSEKNKFKKISGLSDLLTSYDNYLIDLWGVVHNGIKVFPGILEILYKLKEYDKNILFITNAPRRSKVIKEQLKDFGISKNLYNTIISSGEISWLKIKEMTREKRLNCFHIGPERDYHLTQDLDINITKDANITDFILNTGPWGDTDLLENYKIILNELYKFKPLMICANPDKRVIRGKNFMICAGLLAEYFENLGGEVDYFGKPFSEIYDKSFEILNIKDKKRTLIIGDSLENDIKGGLNQNIDTLLVTNGIHKEVNNNKDIDIEKLNDLMMKKNIYAKFIIKKLLW